MLNIMFVTEFLLQSLCLRPLSHILEVSRNSRVLLKYFLLKIIKFTVCCVSCLKIHYFKCCILIADLSQRSIGGETPPQSPGNIIHPSFRTKKSATSMETHWEEDPLTYEKHAHSRYIFFFMFVKNSTECWV